MNISFKNLKEMRLVIVFVLISIVLGGALSSLNSGHVSQKSIVTGGLIGFCIASICAVGHFAFLYRLRYLPFAAHLLLSTAYFTAVASTVMAVKFIFFDRIHDMTTWTHNLVSATLLTLGLSFTSAFVLMLRRMLGPNVLLNFFTGRYYKPVEEERIFMFVDIVASTTIAEKIGHLNFHVFLNDYFYDITDAILSAEGEIYKYVGDEIIVSWRVSDSISNARCIQSFFEIKQSIEKKKQTYLNKFGFFPYCRAGLHCGPVIVGEMGDFKREIAFLGDTVNTTARIQEACREYGTDLLVSSELLNKLQLPRDYKLTSLGEIRLKGKDKPMELFGIEKSQAELLQ
ncbi:MAG: adenylate/guanylate cyclase domain-containing protein [Verrucomicrobia bacterium]|nr:adenylate/guanylate cyclase domain-containing protein [Verrucomicrobiota bacterium]MBU1734934.1 adenylate/guanylate cyclase domain-containing protein [Verrucomicrobiota bacterium]MBU1857895.1 adenylate/guanylate cyclase domain-containing protein [Verrucomicrobiota bacterium]